MQTQSIALQNFLSLLRAVGSLVGAYLVGHAIFGHTVSQDTLSVIGGAALTLASTIWGVATKSSTIEGIESSLRSIGAAVGGLFVAAGKISADQLLTILGAIVPIVAFIQSVVSKSKNQAVASGAATVSKTTNKVVAMLVVLLCLGTMASAQSLTNSLVSQLPDSAKTWKGFRVQGPIAVYAYNKQQGSSALAGLGLAYTWQSLNSDSTGWTVNEAVGIAAYAGGTQAPSSLSMVAAVGPYVSFFDGFLTVGAAYNFPTQKFLAVIGVAIPLFK